MASNGVWDLIELFNETNAIECKWVFKTMKDSLGNIERYKSRFIANGFTDVSKKDSICSTLALFAHFDLELQQTDMKMAFFNGELEEEAHMKQREGFSSSQGEYLVCNIKKSISGMKQTSIQWYLKFHDVISLFDFVKNIMDQCIY